MAVMATEEPQSLALDQKVANMAPAEDKMTVDEPVAQPANGHAPEDVVSVVEEGLAINGKAITPTPASEVSKDAQNKQAFVTNGDLPEQMLSKPESEDREMADANGTVEAKPVAVEEAKEVVQETEKKRAVPAVATSPDSSPAKGSGPKQESTTQVTDDSMDIDVSPEQPDLSSSAEHIESTQETSTASDRAAVMSPQNLTQSADLSKLNIKGTQDDTPVSHADVITPDPPASPAKVSRERDEDPSDEPVAKRAKTESQTDTAEDSIGVAQVLSPAPVNSTDSPADEIPDDKRITQYQSKELRAKIGNIKKTKSGMNFRQSVEKLWPGIWPNYKALVDSPVDLTLFEAKLREDRYSNYGEFKADVRLLYENALKFNGADHIVTRAAGQVREKILVELPAIAKMGEPTKSDKNKSQTTRHAEPRSTHHARNQSHSQPRPAAAAPKPKPEPAAATPVGPPTPASSTAPAFALPPNGVPQIRRDSTRDDGDRPKRPIHPPKSRDLDYHKKGNRKKLEPEMKFFKEVLTEVTKGKYWTCNQWFTYPVDPVALNIPTYFNVIKKPMDLQTMADKLENGEYRNAKDLEKDMRQIVTNSVTFNGENDVTRAARELEKLFNDKLSDKDAWMARNYPSAPAPAASPDPSAHDSEEESEADEEEEDNEQIRSIVARMGEEQGKLSTLLGSKKPDLMMIEIQQNVVNMLQRKLVEEKSKFAETKKPKTKKKTPKTKPKPSAGAGPAASGSKKSTGGSTANKKALPTNKKPAPKKRTIGPLEKAVIAEGINELDGPMINKAVEIIKRDTNQKEDDDGQLELDIELLSHDALSKLYDLIMKAYPSIYASVSQRLEYNKQEEPAQQSKPKNGSSAAAAGSTASKPKKNKPMNKHEQERNIEKLRELKAQFQRQGSGSQEPQPGDGDQTRTGESSEEESDSEEE